MNPAGMTGQGWFFFSHYLWAGAFLVVTVGLLWLGLRVFGAIHRRYDIQAELVTRDNPAVCLVLAGHLLGLCLAVSGALPGTFHNPLAALAGMLIYGLVSIALLHASAGINDKTTLRDLEDLKEIFERRNPAAGLAIAANQVAAGLIIQGLLSGQGTLLSMVVFWVLAQAALVVLATVYDLVTPYKVQAEIAKGNLAVAAGFSGMYLAMANIAAHAVRGDFTAWQRDLTSFGAVVVFGGVAMPLARRAMDGLIFSRRRLTEEVCQDGAPNVGAGVIEGAVYLGLSFLINLSLG